MSGRFDNSSPTPAEPRYGRGQSILFGERYLFDTIGLMSNDAFLAFVDSLGPQDKKAAIETRGSWLDSQHKRYGENEEKREAALRKLLAWGGGPSTGAPRQRHTYRDTDTGMDVTIGSDSVYWDTVNGFSSASNSFDPEVCYSLLRKLQSNVKQRSLETYNEIISVAAGVCGMMDYQGRMGPASGSASGDNRIRFAQEALRYNYNDGNPKDSKTARGYNTWSQYQRNLLGTALDEINEGGFNGLFTDANSKFNNYHGVSLDDLNVSAEKLGTMANRYNRYLTELYLHMANVLSKAGIVLPNDGRGVDAKALSSHVQSVENARTWLRREGGRGAARIDGGTLEELKNSLKEWQMYKVAMDRLVAVSSQLRGLKWAQFTVAYCGGRDKEGTDRYWPWWEPDKQGTIDLYWKAMDLLDRWDAMNSNYDEAVAVGDVTAVRPKESDLEKEPEPYTASAVPGAGGSHGVTPMPSRPPVEGASGGNASFFR